MRQSQLLTLPHQEVEPASAAHWTQRYTAELHPCSKKLLLLTSELSQLHPKELLLLTSELCQLHPKELLVLLLTSELCQLHPKELLLLTSELCQLHPKELLLLTFSELSRMCPLARTPFGHLDLKRKTLN